MNRSVRWPVLVAASALLGACAVVPAPVGPYGGVATGNVPGAGYGGYESAQGGYEPAPAPRDGYYTTPAPVYAPSNSGYYGTDPYYYGSDPYYGGYAPGYAYPVYPSVGVTVPLIVDPPRTYVRPRPIIVVPDDHRRDYRRDYRRDDRRDDRRDARPPYHPDPRANVPYDRARPTAPRVYRNVPQYEGFVPRDERGEADARARREPTPQVPGANTPPPERRNRWAPFAPRAREQVQQTPRSDSSSAPAAARTSPGSGARTERPAERQAAPRGDRVRESGGAGRGRTGSGEADTP